MFIKNYISAAAILFLVVGLAWPLWPLSVVGVLLMGLSGRGKIALILGLLLDIVYVPPLYPMTHFFFPGVAAALLSIVLQRWSRRFVFEKATPRGSL